MPHDVYIVIPFEITYIFDFQVHIGVNGRVVDDDTGAGIPDAVVSVLTIEKNITTDEFGYFWRLLTHGTYILSVSKPGYVTTLVLLTDL